MAPYPARICAHRPLESLSQSIRCANWRLSGTRFSCAGDNVGSTISLRRRFRAAVLRSVGPIPGRTSAHRSRTPTGASRALLVNLSIANASPDLWYIVVKMYQPPKTIPNELKLMIAASLSSPADVEALCGVDSSFDALRMAPEFREPYNTRLGEVIQNNPWGKDPESETRSEPWSEPPTSRAIAVIQRPEGVENLRQIAAQGGDAQRRRIYIGLGSRPDAAAADLTQLRTDRDDPGDMSGETRKLRAQAAAALLMRPDAPQADVTGADNLYAHLNARSTNTPAGENIGPARVRRAVARGYDLGDLRWTRDNYIGGVRESVAIADALMEHSPQDRLSATQLFESLEVEHQARLASRLARVNGVTQDELDFVRMFRDDQNVLPKHRLGVAAQIVYANGATPADRVAAENLLTAQPAAGQQVSPEHRNSTIIALACTPDASPANVARLRQAALDQNITTPKGQAQFIGMYANMVLEGHDTNGVREKARSFALRRRTASAAAMYTLLLGDDHNVNPQRTTDLQSARTKWATARDVAGVVLQEAVAAVREREPVRTSDRELLRAAGPSPGTSYRGHPRTFGR